MICKNAITKKTFLFESFQRKTHPKVPIYCGGTGSIGPSGVTGAKTPLLVGGGESGVAVGLGEVAVDSAPVVPEEPGPDVRSAQAPIMKTALTSAKRRAVRLVMT